MREVSNEGVELKRLTRAGKLVKPLTALADTLLSSKVEAATGKR
jgi:hypothetical protein